MKIYTIGFTKKNAETFFELLRDNNVKKILDIRLNNVSQLAGFAKGNDLEYFANTILGIPYKHDLRFAPSKEIFDKNRAGKMSWSELTTEFEKLLSERNAKDIILKEYKDELDGICLLCSEADARQCHRSILAEYIKNIIPGAEIINL